MYVPYLHIPAIALICYLFLLIALFSKRHNRIVQSFSWLLVFYVFWTGGSMFMRMLLWPGYKFWFHISIASLFCIPLLLYSFLYEFVGCKNTSERRFVRLLTALFAIPTLLDVYLPIPTPEQISDTKIVFRYQADWRVIPACLICLIIVTYIVKMIWPHLKNAVYIYILVGILILAVGNLISVMPGNTFPYDTLAGILNAGLLFWALYRRHLFQLNIFIAPRTVGAITVLIVCIIGLSAADFMLLAVSSVLPSHYIDLLPSVAFFLIAIATTGLYQFLNYIAQHFLLGQNKVRILALQEFSSTAARNPKKEELQENLLLTIMQIYGDVPLCLFLLDESQKAFVPVYPQEVQAQVSPIKVNDPCAVWFASQTGCVRARQVQAMGLSIAPDKASMMQDNHISCIVPFQDQNSLQGILFLGLSGRQKDYSDEDLMFFSSLGSIASVGFKNASLYERLYREARTDQLTGLLNRRAFIEILEEYHSQKHPFTLVLLDIDDFKLYNQLYGAHEGDHALCRIAGLAANLAGNDAYVCRYSNKVFSALLPDADEARGVNFARSMSTAASGVTDDKLCRITFSSGTYCYQGGSETAAQILEHADMAVFYVKQHGKNNIRRYTGQDSSTDIISAEESQASASTIYAITAAIDAKDHYTFSHSQNVADYARILAQELCLDESHVQMIYQAGLVHDVGKLAMPEHILSKPGRLTREEYKIMQSHVESSIAIIRNLPSLDYVVPAAVTHHENWDGSGYPRGLKGTEIPLGGRCLALADAFDAMTSTRSYKPAYSKEFALQQIQENSGRQFDPNLAEIFIRLVEEGRITPVSHK